MIFQLSQSFALCIFEQHKDLTHKAINETQICTFLCSLPERKKTVGVQKSEVVYSSKTFWTQFNWIFSHMQMHMILLMMIMITMMMIYCSSGPPGAGKGEECGTEQRCPHNCKCARGELSPCIVATSYI